MDIIFDHIKPIPLEGTFQEHQIWNQSFRFIPGKTYMIHAFSGRGKTTLLSIIYGLRKDYTGVLQLANKPHTSYTLNDWALLRRSHISMLFQDMRLFPQLTALENILVKNQLTQYYTEEQILERAKMLDVDSLLHRKCMTLSLGQQQRIALIRCICQPFEWLLLDEPFSHLDEQNANRCFNLIQQEIQSRQAGLILTSLGGKLTYTFDSILTI